MKKKNVEHFQELRDQIRRLQESERLSTRNLERQRADILQAFKKQTTLVDNLKRQKVRTVRIKKKETYEITKIKVLS